MIIKLYGFGFRKYANDYFNLFDGVVVILSAVEIVIEQVTASNSTGDTSAVTEDGEEVTTTSGTSAISAFRAIRIFRTFRVLRVSRMLRGLRFMKVIVEVIGGAIEQFTYITLLLFLMIFIFSLLGMQFFGGKFDFRDQAITRQNFDTFLKAF